MGELRYYEPMKKNVLTSTTTLSLDFIVPAKKGIKLLQIRGMLAATYTGTFSYTLVKDGDPNYNQKFDIGVASDNVYKELNLICSKDDIIRLTTESNVAAATHYFELGFGGDGS